MLFRETRPLGPRPGPIASSLIVHAFVLASIAFGPRGGSEKPKSLYKQVFEPSEKKLVWYRFSKKLPEISPPEPVQESKRMKAEALSPQPIISQPKQADPGQQMAWVPAPELKLDRDLKAPNLMAFEKIQAPAPPRQARAFTPPPAPARNVKAPELPQAPALEASRALDAKGLPERIKAPPKQFVPPPKAAPRTDAALALPAAPELSLSPTAGSAAMLPKVARPAPRAFVPPASARPTEAAPVLSSAAPALGATLQPGEALVVLDNSVASPVRPAPRAFIAPPSRGPSGKASEGLGSSLDAAEAPQVNSGTASLTAVVAGLNPTSSLTPVVPSGSRTAAFSAGPTLSKEGGAGERGSGRTLVPGLIVKGDVAKQAEPTLMARSLVQPTSRENLLEVARSTLPPKPGEESRPRPLAPRVSAAPDVMFDGRIIYTMAIQMPNVTSYSGSWMVWFAERAVVAEDTPGVNAPVPLRKVDPVYDLSAIEERVEGKVRLVAVIRKDGHVDAVSVLQGADARLDRSAAAALRKWEFEPARRNGRAVDVDAIVEIPFRLAPRKQK